jgi:hypothetical protein
MAFSGIERNLLTPPTSMYSKTEGSVYNSFELYRIESKTRFYELYQDFGCVVVLRIAKESFVLLQIEAAIITAYGKHVKAKTDYI